MRKWLVAALQRALLRLLTDRSFNPGFNERRTRLLAEPCSFGSFSDLDAARVKVRFMPLNGRGRREAKTHAWLLWAYCRLSI